MKELNEISNLVKDYLIEDKNFKGLKIQEGEVIVDFNDINDGDYHRTLLPYIRSKVSYDVAFMYGDGDTFILIYG